MIKKLDVMYKVVILLLLIFATISCSEIEKSIHITMTNDSQYELTEIQVFVAIKGLKKLYLPDSVVIQDLQPGEQISRPIVFNRELFPTEDGEYYLRFKQNDEIVGRLFGYFSNGAILDKGYEITVTDDKVNVVTILK